MYDGKQNKSTCPIFCAFSILRFRICFLHQVQFNSEIEFDCSEVFGDKDVRMSVRWDEFSKLHCVENIETKGEGGETS